jgi:hypothetical protein
MGGYSKPRPGRFNPLERDASLVVHEAGWNPMTVWTGTENFALTRFRSPHRPTGSESLYRLSYPGPLTGYYGLLCLLELVP